jgi:putative membrane protein
MSYLMDWQLEPPSTTVGLLALLYAAGWRRRPRRRAAHRHAARRQAACFAAGVAALVLALNSPLAALDDQLFWAHMTQHVLLLAVAPPLLLLGRPGPTIWGTLPLPMRRAATQEVRRLAERAWARAAWRIATAPTTAQISFVGTLALWHLPVLYDATLRSPALHLLEHQTFLASGLLLWSQLVDSPPLRSRLGYPARALHATVATAASWLLAIALALGSEPLYQGYARLAWRPGGISALADEQLAAGIMWVPGSIPFAVAILWFTYRWLEPERSEHS